MVLAGSARRAIASQVTVLAVVAEVENLAVVATAQVAAAEGEETRVAVAVGAAPVAGEVLEDVPRLDAVALAVAAAAAMLTTAAARAGAVESARALCSASAATAPLLQAVTSSVLVIVLQTASPRLDVATEIAATSARGVLIRAIFKEVNVSLYRAAPAGATIGPAGTVRNARKVVLALKTALHA